MKVLVENSYKNKDESISVGNKMLYQLCEENPLNDDVNGLIAKIWLIGRSYAASPERRSYAKDYLDNHVFVKKSEKDGKIIDEKVKLDLNTGSNGTDSFFMKLSKLLIENKEYDNIIQQIQSLKDKKYTFEFAKDKDLLQKSVKVVLDFNKLLRSCIEKCDEKALMDYERKTGKKKEDRNLKYFISFCSKFMHFHLPNLVFIMDSYSFAHAKRKVDGKRNGDFIFFDNNGAKLFSMSSNIEYLKIEDCLNEKEKNYLDHVSRCYAIMCKLHELNKANITPRMFDNFIMYCNVDTKPEDTE